MTTPKVLVLDIETSPNIAAVFGLKNQFVGLNQILTPSRVFSFAAKWRGQDDSEMVFYRGDTEPRRKRMVKAAWDLLDEADAVAHYNGQRFDVPKLRGEAVAYGLSPWRPFRQVDLWNTAKRFGYVSSKLDHVLDRLNLDRKLSNEGMALWLSCMGYGPQDREEAWTDMEAYNRQDVSATDALLTAVAPWMNDLPNAGLYDDGDAVLPKCDACGGHVMRSGTYQTKLGEYPAYRCKAKTCRRWLRSKRAIRMSDLRSVPS